MVQSGMLIDTQTIARIAGVTPAAVSNWRRRHDTFPVAAQTSGNSPLYLLGDIERWLVEEGKITGRVDPANLLVPMLDIVGYEYTLEGVADVLTAFTLYAAITSGAARYPEGVDEVLPDELQWEQLRALEPARRRGGVKNALVVVGEHLGLGPLTDAVRIDEPVVNDTFVDLIDTICEMFVERGPSVASELEHELEAYLKQRDKFAGSYYTPDWLRGLMGELVRPAGPTIYDPACGTGHLLRATAWLSDADGAELLGNEINAQLQQRAQAWLYIHGMDGWVSNRSGLDLDERITADTVVTWPPMAQKDWADADTYLDDRWPLAPVSANDATTAWVQRAWMTLKPNGIAAIGLPAGAALRSGPTADLRRALIDQELLHCVIHLPDGVLPTASIRTSIWLLSRQSTGRPPLIVDATDLGDRARAGTTLDQTEKRQIVDIVHRWIHDGSLDDDSAERAYPADTSDTDRLTVEQHRPVRHRPVEQVYAELHAVEELRPNPTEDQNSSQPELPDLNTWRGDTTSRLVPLTQLAQIIRPAANLETTTEEDAAEPVLVILPRALLTGEPFAEYTDAAERSDLPRIRPGDFLLPLIADAETGPELLPAPPEAIGATISGQVVILRPAHDDSTAAWLRLWFASPLSTQAFAARSSPLGGRTRLSLDGIEVPVPRGQLLEEATTLHEWMERRSRQLHEEATRLSQQADLVAELATTITQTA